LKNINLEIKFGEIVCIIGQVGAGKTALLDLILDEMMLDSNKEKKIKFFVNGNIAYVS
jgi:ABC-type lipoprotein export system ATPase subunit